MTTTTRLEFGFKSDPGKKRQINEDSCAVLNRDQLNGRLDGLMVVADGLGGRRAGEVASSLLVETVSLGVLETTASRSRAFTGTEVEQLLADTIVRANGKIMTQSRFEKRTDARGMATTCVSAIIHENLAIVGNVGDSRLYMLRGVEMEQVTQDHSEVFREYMQGNLTETEARNHRFRNQITRAVGLEANVEPDITVLNMREGDTILLCSDGLTTEVPDEMIATVLACSPTAQEACDNLVQLALRQGGRDNITVVVMRFGAFVPAHTLDLDALKFDEPDTDPNQEWRNNPAPDDEPSWADDEPIHTPDAKRQDPVKGQAPTYRRGGSAAAMQVTLALVGLLALGMMVEGAIIFNLHQQLKSAPAPMPKPAPEPEASVVHNYNPPALVMKTSILPDVLQLSAKGRPVVATQDGVLQTLLVDQHKLLPMRGLVPTMPPLVKDASHHTKGHSDIFTDSAGNLFYLNPTTKCIETYTAEGTRTNSDLGKGELTAPTRLIVDGSGSIYVIDDYQLKVLTVKQSPAATTHPANADY